MAERRSRQRLPTIPPDAEPLKPASQSAVIQTTFDLARELSLHMREEELGNTFVNKLHALFPRRLLCLRVVDPKTLALKALVAHGRALPRLRAQPLHLKRTMLERTYLPSAIFDSGRVEESADYEPVLEGAVTGFSVPLVASRELFGLLNVEYGAEIDLSEQDEPVAILLANQLSMALSNLKLFGEARYYRDYLRQVIDVANALIVAIDREGRIAVMNRAMQEMVGLGPDVIGTHLIDLRDRSAPILTDAHGARLETLLLDGLDGKEYLDCEVVLVRSDGRQVSSVFNTSVVRRPAGNVDGVIAIGQDRERVRMLERQIIQAEKLATLGQLAAGVVHELNNPLTSISVYGSYLQQLFMKSGNYEDLEKANKVVDGASRIQKLTRDLTSYARPSGDFEPIALNDVVRQAVSFCEHVIKRSDAVVECQLDELSPHVAGIKTQLGQVLINLITNACHALPAPGQKVLVRTSLSPTGDSAILEVTDSGVGIEKLDGERIFEPFFTTKQEGKGTGLGLSIVKNIVEGHGGRITFESSPGEGTTFLIMFPAHREQREGLK